MPQQSASSLAIVALILGLGSWVFGGIFTAIPAVVCAKMELGKIDRGESSEAGRQFAQIGWWSGIIFIGFTLLTVILVCGFGVLYMLFVGVMVAGSAGAT